MQTIKTAVVVVLLLGVCYGAYVALNAPEPVLPPELEAWSSENGGMDLDVEEGSALSIDIPQLGDASSSDVDALTPPNMASLSPLSSSSSAQPQGDVPTLPTIDVGSMNSSKIGNLLDTPPPAAEFGLPPELEGSSVPIPNTGQTKSPAVLLTVVPKPEDSNTITLPGFPGAAAGSASGNPLAPLPGTRSPSNGGSPGQSPTAQNGTEKPQQPFKAAREEALKLASDGKLREALAKMSPYYKHIELTRDEQLDLIDMLDSLAGEVIYSKRHLLEPPFIVSSGDTLESIANRFRMSPETLARINMMADSKLVMANTQMKVFNGPMRAEVNLTRGELTLFLQDLYAGRFPISVGHEPAPVEGTFQIADRRRDRTYYGANSQVLPATDGRNPYGGYWMSLGKDMCIHGSPATTTPEMSNAGCISLAPLDAREVYSLLTQGSQVTIHR